MAAEDEHRIASVIGEPDGAARPRHYLVAMLLVGGMLAGLASALDRTVPSDAPSDLQDAVLVDLPPLEAGGRPPGEDAPTQEAAPNAAAAEPAPPTPHQIVPPGPALVETPAVAPPQQQPDAPAATPQASHVTGAPQSARTTETDADDDETRRASTHRITLWQKTLMARLQAARHGLHERVRGLVEIAFEIDRHGDLVSERITRGSGAAALDIAALALVRRAAPFPKPPRDADRAQLSFVVPISFRP